jgi:hypothetical protein
LTREFGGRPGIVPEDALSQGVEIAEDRFLQIALTRGGTEINGRVRDSGDKDVSLASVVLLPRDRTRSHLYKRVITDTDGRYQLSGVAPGRYELFAWTAFEGGAFRNPEFMQPYENLGTTVEVKANPIEVDLRTVDRMR